MPGIDGVPVVTLNEGCKLLNGGDDDWDRLVIDLLSELPCGLVGGDGPLGIRVVFANSLMVEILAVDDEEDLVDPFHAGGKLSGFEGGKGLSRARRVPDVSAGGNTAGLPVHG